MKKPEANKSDLTNFIPFNQEPPKGETSPSKSPSPSSRPTRSKGDGSSSPTSARRLSLDGFFVEGAEFQGSGCYLPPPGATGCW